MATHGARRLGAMTVNLSNVIAIEFLAACQGIDFRSPLKTSPSLQQAHDALRARVPFATEDRLLAEDIRITGEVIRTPAVQALADFLLPSFA
jgi:histidine ammonia-lyase